MKRKFAFGIAAAIIVALPCLRLAHVSAASPAKEPVLIPKFEYDPTWPKLTGHFGDHGDWIFGALGGIAVDLSNDHVWLIQRPGTLDAAETLAAANPPLDDCCKPAPRVMEFDAAGNYVNGWGGPGKGYDWPEIEHGIKVDYRGNVWIGGSGKKDNQLLKFTRTGRFLMQIGHPGQTKGETDPENMNTPSCTFLYQKTNELFVSDGYVNRRVVVFDGETGKFKRTWGAYGKSADDRVPRVLRFPLTEGIPVQTVAQNPPPQQFNLPHSIRVSNDGLVYVGDRSNNRVQIFHIDGAFVKEVFLRRDFFGPVGTAVDLDFSPDKAQKFLYVMSGDEKLRILNRETLQVLSEFGHLGHFPGEFFHTHAIAVDSKGNIYTAEAGTLGRRVTKFEFKGFVPARNE
jgi:sugar lactone lactonase YvrE